MENNLTLKELRKENLMTQKEAADYLNISLRSYISYENDEEKMKNMKYEQLKEMLLKRCLVDEEHGILSLDFIKKTVAKILDGYDVSFCYLFGSYAKNKANDLSDVDLMVSTTITGLDFFGLIEELREALHKKVDLLTLDQLVDNENMLYEIFKDGIKIYG